MGPDANTTRARVRGVTLGLLVTLLLGACSAVTQTRTFTAPSAPASPTPPPFPWERDDPDALPATVPLDEIRPGGPPPDGIPPIDDPVFESVADAGTWLAPTDPVLVLTVDGTTKAYPLAVLTWHEIVNDTIAGSPVTVTYCPLCNSALVFDRRVGDEVLDFGTSGRLWRSNLVMYDRRSRSLWSQFTGEAIVGERVGTTLTRLPAQLVSFATLAAADGPGAVLSRDTGARRPYGENPYVGYDDADGAPFLFDGEVGGPVPPMTRVVVPATGPPRAIPLERLMDEQVVAVEGAPPLVVLWAPGTASALDTRAIAEGRDVGATGVFVATLDGAPLALTAVGDGTFTDRERGVTVDIRGRVLDGGTGMLRAVPHDDTFWFVQSAFRPATEVLGGR